MCFWVTIVAPGLPRTAGELLKKHLTKQAPFEEKKNKLHRGTALVELKKKNISTEPLSRRSNFLTRLLFPSQKIHQKSNTIHFSVTENPLNAPLEQRLGGPVICKNLARALLPFSSFLLCFFFSFETVKTPRH